MTHKMRKTLIMIVMAALIICLMAASLTYTFTYGLYTGGKFDSEKSPYDDLIEFVGAREYTVRSPEELIQAIEDGYSNIVIAEDAEQPFVITEGVTDVTANLVLNLNGNVVVRNSRNPMLDVQTNVSVVLVYDSTNNGAFYNPVGSSLMASGGSLTVGSGGYESGPRAEEYEDENSADELSQLSSDVAIFTRGGIDSPDKVNRATQLDYQEIEASSELVVPKTTGRYYRKTAGSGYKFVPADTFLIYTEEENCFIGDGTPSGGVTFEEGKLYVDAELEEDGSSTQITATEFKTPLCDVASCDFYYYYPVSGKAGTAKNPQKYAIVYGYWDVMKLASNDGGTAEDLREKGLVYPYGAVRMVEGEGIVRGGTFANHFDVANTYGIYAEGGRLSVSRNTTFGTTFSSGGEGVCIRSSGESAELTISGGDFSSEIGNTIEMLNGNMTVTKGSFTKTDCKKGTGDAQLENQTAIISLMGGTLNVSGAQSGDVTMTAGAENSTLENVFGIRAAGGGTVTTKGVNFNIYGDYSAGVLSYDGTIDLGNDTAINVEQSDQYKNGNNILLTSAGVSSEQTPSGVSENEEHPVNLSGKNVTIASNGLGITARGVVNVKVGSTSTVTTTCGTGIYVNNGKFNVDKDAIINVKSTVLSGYSWTTPPESQTTNAPNIYNGVYVQGGSITSEGTLNVEHTGVASDANAGERYSSYAVSVESGNVTLGSGAIAGKSAGGIYVSGGELTAGAVTVSAGGTPLNDNFTANASTYAAGVLVETGTVTLSGAKIYSTALGVAVLGGNFKTEGTSSVTATRATGIYVQGGTVTNSGTLEVTSDLFDDSGNLYESAGADFGGSSTAGGNIYNGIFVNGGSLVSEGVSSILNVTFRGAAGDEPSSASGATKSYAVYVTNSSDDGATETTNTYASIREGALNAVQAGGVYLHGGDVVLGAQYNENDEVVGHGTVAIKTGSLNGNTIDTSAGTYGAGVFADNGEAVLYGTVNVECAALGIVAVGSGSEGDTVSIAEGAAVTVTASRATGIYVQGGTVTNSGTLEVTSDLFDDSGNLYESAGADFGGSSTAGGNIYNGIFVNGGSLDSKGTLNVTFTGVAADPDETTSFPTDVQTKSYAVYVDTEADASASDTVTVAGGTINAAQAGGVYVENGAVSLGASSKNVTINTGGWNNTEDQIVSTQGTYASAVYAHGGSVTMNGTVNINSAALGIVAVGVVNTDGSTAAGAVTIESGTTTIKAYRSTGVYIRGGSLTNDGTLDVTSTIKNSTGGTANTAAEAYKWAGADIEDDLNNSNIYNGVFVNGGSLDSKGTLKVDFTGVENESKYDIDTLLETYDITLPTIGEDGIGSTTQRFWDDDNTVWNDFYTAYQSEFNTPSFQEVQQAVSYAVRVEGDANTTVTIASGQITNSVGGGVLVNGGTVDLGTSANNLEIHAEGNRTIDKTYIYTFTKETGTDYHDWWWHDYYEYTIEVRSAMYFAEIDEPAQNWAYRENQTGGDAVRVEGGELTIVGGNYTSAQGNGIVAVGGKTTINGGTFNGSDNYKVKDGNGLVVPAGPAASYAFKVYGGEITVNAGTFGDRDSDSGASGGFVMGTLADAPGTAYINGGTFDVSNGNTGGQAGFGVYRYANVTFGKETDTTDDGIKVTGLAAGLVLERTPGDSGTTVTINSGTFSSTRTTRDTASDGVWYGNGTSKLNITGGTFTGVGRSGIQLDEDPSNNVRITGGIFKANQGYPISGYFNQVVPQEYGIISGSNTRGGSCTIG